MAWLPPAGMTGRVLLFESRQGVAERRKLEHPFSVSLATSGSCAAIGSSERHKARCP